MRQFYVSMVKIKFFIPIALLILALYWFTVEKYYGMLFPTIAICLFLVGIAAWDRLDIRKKRRQGIYPEIGQTTMGDVKRLALNGYDELALRAYLEINETTLKKGRQAIQDIKSEA